MRKMILKTIVRVILFFSIVNNAHQSFLNYQVVKVFSGTGASNTSNYEFYLLSNGVAKVKRTIAF